MNEPSTPRGMRLILDTNVFVAAGFRRDSASAQLVEAVRDGRLVLVWNSATRDEAERVVGRIPRLRVDRIRPLFTEAGCHQGPVEPERFQRVPDPADRKFAALAAATGVPLVSSDSDLLDAGLENELQVLKPSEAWAKLVAGGKESGTDRPVSGESRHEGSGRSLLSPSSQEAEMESSRKSPPTRTPWQVWVTGVLALLWNAMGAMDYVMTQTRNPDYMSKFTPEQLEFFTGFPAWVVASWAIAVWGGVLGSIFLLLRRRWAVRIFLVSFLAMVVTTVHNYVIVDGLAVMDDAFSLIFSMVIFVVAFVLFVYARSLQAKGILR